jgi:hypothetical protein
MQCAKNFGTLTFHIAWKVLLATASLQGMLVIFCSKLCSDWKYKHEERYKAGNEILFVCASISTCECACMHSYTCALNVALL